MITLFSLLGIIAVMTAIGVIAGKLVSCYPKLSAAASVGVCLGSFSGYAFTQSDAQMPVAIVFSYLLEGVAFRLSLLMLSLLQ